MKITERQSDKRKTVTTVCLTPAEAMEVIQGLAVGVKMARFSKHNDGKWVQPVLTLDEFRDVAFRVED